MNKILLPIMLVCLTMASCGKTNSLQNQTPTTQVDPNNFSDPEWWGNIDLETICDKDDWLHGTKKQQSNALTACLLDAYNSFVVRRDIINDMELFRRFGKATGYRLAACRLARTRALLGNDDEPEDGTDTVQAYYTYEAIASLDCSIISDPMTRAMADTLKAYAIQAQRDTGFDGDFEYYNTYMRHICQTYHVDNFGTLTEEDYWEAMDRSKVVEDYESLHEKRMSDDTIYQARLAGYLAEETDIDKRCVYAMEYAHSSSDGPYFAAAIPHLVQIMASGQYSPFLIDVWRTWRAIQSAQMGMSTYSVIPNLQYNQMRNLCAQTILDHIRRTPDDMIAINIFLVLGFQDNIRRFGDFPFGNQSVTEQMEVFPEYFEQVWGRND